MGKVSLVKKHGNLIAIAILVLGLVFYLYRIDRWFMDDDEGGFCYAAWRVSEGEVPYRDFLTEQVPLFLYWGGAVVRLFGPSVMALRYATVLTTLIAAYFMYLVANKVFGYRVALLSLPLFLMHQEIYLIARFFRPEAYMLLFSALSAYTFVRVYPGRRWGLFLSGTLSGLAMLFKLFAVLPAAGCGLFILNRWYRSGERRLIGDLLALTAGFCATTGTVFVAFQVNHPAFLTAVFKLHVMQGAELSRLQVLAKGFKFYWGYLIGNPVFLLLAMLGAASAVTTQADISQFYAWQIPTAAAFLMLSRSLQDRHLVYLLPALCALAAVSLERILAGELLPLAVRQSGDQIKAGARRWLWLALGVSATVFTLWPFWRGDMEVAGWEDLETQQLTQYVQAHTDTDDIVLCDYLELNFHPLRRSTYLGAGLSGVATSSGRITGAALINEIEELDVKMVLINTSGGAHHLVNLRDFDAFYGYVQGHFRLVSLFHRSYQTFEVYDRRDLMPLLPKAQFGGKLALTGADLGSATVEAGQSLSMTLRWRALRAMERDYTVSLRLVDESGHRCSQQDVPLLRTFTSRWEGSREIIEKAPTSRWASGDVVMDDYQMLVSHGTPPGKYRLAVVVYHLDSGEVLQALDEDGRAVGTEYVLDPVKVVSPDKLPSLDEFAIHRSLMEDLGGELQLLGRGPIVEQARPGDSLHLVLFWRALRKMESDWQLHLRVRGPEGSILAEGQFDLANSHHPTSQWAEGEVVLGQYDLTLDPVAPPGQVQLTLDLVGKVTGQPLLGHDSVFASLKIEGRKREFAVPEAIQNPLTVNLGNRVILRGYDLAETSVKPGSVLHLTLYWQALTTMKTSYTVFTHLLDGEGRIWGQKDSVPLQCTYPTTGWLPGEVIVDEYEIAVRPEAPPGEHVLEIGMYSAATWERLPVLDEEGQELDNRIFLTKVMVSK